MHTLFDHYLMLIWLQIIPIIQSVKPKFEYPDQIIMTHYLILIR
jgi:hypothetical protein